MRSHSNLRTRGALRNFFTNRASFSRTPWWKWFLFSNAEIAPLLNGTLRRHRTCPMDPYTSDRQFPCEAHQSCTLRTEESPSGPTAMTKTHLGGSVWLHISQSGLNTNRVLDKALPQLPRNKSFSGVFNIRSAFGDIQPYTGSKVCTKQTQNWSSRSTSSWTEVKAWLLKRREMWTQSFKPWVPLGEPLSCSNTNVWGCYPPLSVCESLFVLLIPSIK